MSPVNPTELNRSFQDNGPQKMQYLTVLLVSLNVPLVYYWMPLDERHKNHPVLTLNIWTLAWQQTDLYFSWRDEWQSLDRLIASF